MTSKNALSPQSAITRRRFLHILGGAFSAAILGCSKKEKHGSLKGTSNGRVQFHVVADVHNSTFRQGKSHINWRTGEKFNPLGSYRDIGISHWKLDEAVRQFNKHPDADFLIELGDLKSSPKEIPNVDTTADIIDACARLDKWGRDIYHVVGNHDLEMCAEVGVEQSDKDWDTYIAALDAAGHHFSDNDGHLMNNPSRNSRGYYSWTIRNFLFIVVDVNGGWDDNTGELSYYNGSGHYKPAKEQVGNPADWENMKVGIHQEQLNWIADQLDVHPNKSVVFFSHHCLGRNDWGTPEHRLKPFFIRNHEAFHQTILNHHSNPDRVICISGHAHPGVFNNTRDGVRYYNIRGMVLGTTDKTHWGSYGAGG
jgi:hypothetical protein